MGTHPLELSARVIESGVVDEPLNRVTNEITELAENLAIVESFSHSAVGAGSGYHSALLSKMVGTGKVFAVDVEPEMIAYLNARIKQEKL